MNDSQAPSEDHAPDRLPAESAASAAPDAAAETAPDRARDDTPGAYRVLARKYRPQTFDQLIGQDPMVRTLANSFAAGRIAQAWMLTGVRGVGKTTTARILARALNYQRDGDDTGPTMDLSEPGIHCDAIMEGRHIDVIEMDAASHTGIGDIREIIDAARYRPATARYKVYLIDEVHMLSGPAFNGLLKTLEEPPEHVKFIFATTEIRKVPVTVLSRCQRFDLRRIETPALIEHLQMIAKAEAVEADDDALRAIARAAEGSVRDALSLFDQAIAHGAGKVTAEAVREMLGLADHGRTIDLFEATMRGDVAAALAVIRDLSDIGADPVVTLSAMAEFTHFVTRLKHVPDTANDPAVSEEEKTRGRVFADNLSVRILSRTWQMLLKGIDEVKSAPRALAAAEMVLVRLCYAADLPTPDEVLRKLAAGETPAIPPAPATPQSPSPAGESAHRAEPGASGAPPMAPRSQTGGGPVLAAQTADPIAARPHSAPAAAETSPRPVLQSLADVAAYAQQQREVKLKFDIERYARPIAFETGRIEIAIDPAGPPDLAGNLGRKLGEWTGSRWIVAVGRESPEPTLYEVQAQAEAALIGAVKEDPLVAQALDRFPGARIVKVRDKDAADDDRGSMESESETD